MGVDGRLHGGDAICSSPSSADAASRALNLLALSENRFVNCAYQAQCLVFG